MKKLLHAFTALILLLTTFSSSAKVYSTLVLQEANKYLAITPKQSLLSAQQYLDNRQLIEQFDQKAALSRNSNERAIRTPSSSVDAMQIIAQAHFLSGNPRMALLTIEEAEKFAALYQLPINQIESQLIHAHILWQQSHQGDKTEQILQQIEQQITQLDGSLNSNDVLYHLHLFRAETQVYQGQLTDAKASFTQAEQYLALLNDNLEQIDYQQKLAQFYLTSQAFDSALTELLKTYWLAIKEDASIQLASTNLLLAKLYHSRQVLDKSLQHATEAADFYSNYPQSRQLLETMDIMAQTYFKQGKYNLALVHYFNMLDNEPQNIDAYPMIQLRIDIARTYLMLFNNNQAYYYFEQANKLVQFADYPDLKAKVALLHAKLALATNKTEMALDNANQALLIADKIHDVDIKMIAYQALATGYERKKQYLAALNALQKYQALWSKSQAQFNAVNEEVFRQQKDIIERTLHYSGLENELQQMQQQYSKAQRIGITMLGLMVFMLLLLLRKNYLLQKLQDDQQILTKDLYTHPRSGLQNLKLLNAKLPASLQQSSANFEQWRLGELINEPLLDRLHFVMFEIPLLRNVYLQKGYEAGLALEKAFGKHLKTFIHKPARLYHFSDAIFLYIEPQGERCRNPEELYQTLNSWINSFQHPHNSDSHIHMGVAEYPFLSKSYTAINDKELIDILLLAVYLAQGLNQNDNEHSNQWVHLSAIENAPAASFAADNIRHASQQAINQGIIKIRTRCGQEEQAKKILADYNLT